MLLFVLLFFEVAGRVGLGPRLLLDRLFTLGSLAFGLERASSLAVGGWVCVCVEGGSVIHAVYHSVAACQSQSCRMRS